MFFFLLLLTTKKPSLKRIKLYIPIKCLNVSEHSKVTDEYDAGMKGVDHSVFDTKT